MLNLLYWSAAEGLLHDKVDNREVTSSKCEEMRVATNKRLHPKSYAAATKSPNFLISLNHTRIEIKREKTIITQQSRSEPQSSCATNIQT